MWEELHLNALFLGTSGACLQQVCARSVPQGQEETTHISTLLPVLFGIAHYYQPVDIFHGIHCIFYSRILLFWCSAENLPRGYLLGHDLKATKLACNRKRKPFQNVAPTLNRLVAVGVQNKSHFQPNSNMQSLCKRTSP